MSPGEVCCRLCQCEVARATAREERWHHDVKGWICRSHSPIDWPEAAYLAHDAARHLDEAMDKLFALDVTALGDIDEALVILGELREATAALRKKAA